MSTSTQRGKGMIGRVGAPRLLSDAQIAEATKLIEQGAHPGAVAAQFDVSTATLYNRVISPLRDRQRRERESQVA